MTESEKGASGGGNIFGDFAVVGGDIVPLLAARESVFLQKSRQSEGLFETFPVTRGVPIYLELHYERMERSAHALGYRLLFSYDELVKGVLKLYHAIGAEDSRMRLNLSKSDEGSFEWWLTVGKMPEIGRPFRLITCPTESMPLAMHKIMRRQAYDDFKNRAVDSGADEAILTLKTGEVLEGTMTNVFIVNGDEVITTPTSSPILPGIARRVLVGLMREAGLRVSERPFFVGELMEADEVFLTNSVRGVVPVVMVDGKKFRFGHGRGLTNRVSGVYNDGVERYISLNREKV